VSMTTPSQAASHADLALAALRQIVKLVGRWDVADECGLPYERRTDAEDAMDLVGEVGVQTALLIEALRRELRAAQEADHARLQRVAEQGEQASLMDVT
jgi:hypothetical protein